MTVISFLFIIFAFLIGYSLNPSNSFIEGLEAGSTALALLGVYVAHLLAKHRERVKEYENIYSFMNGICSFAKRIADIVEASKKEYKKGDLIVAPLPSIEIFTVCSEELLKTYKKDVDKLDAKHLFDPDSVEALLNFKLHFDLFSQYVQIYMDFHNKMNPEIKKCVDEYSQIFLIENKLNRSNEAKKFLTYRDQMLVSHFNIHCNSIVNQCNLLIKQKDQIGRSLLNVKKNFF